MRRRIAFAVVVSSLTLLSYRTGAQELPADFDPKVFMDAVYADLEAACSAGIEKCECMNAPGTFSDGPFNPNEDPIGALITFVGCGPGYCFCKDNPKIEIDVRPQFFSSIQDLCPRGELNRCLCKDGRTKSTAPFDVMKAYACQPRKCKCNGSNKVKINQAFGCKKGGYVTCPNMDDLYCKDGTNLNPNNILKWRRKSAKDRWATGKSSKGCACPDGIMPRCRGTGKPPHCPKGKAVDWSLGGMDEIAGCRHEEW